MEENLQNAIQQYLREHLKVNVSVSGESGFESCPDHVYVGVNVRVGLLLDGEEIASDQAYSSLS